MEAHFGFERGNHVIEQGKTQKRAMVDQPMVSDSNRTREELAGTAVSLATRPRGRRPKVQRRRQIDPTTCERDYQKDEIEFMTAMDKYKRENGRPFPTCGEVLEVLHSLGYHRDEGSKKI